MVRRRAKVFLSESDFKTSNVPKIWLESILNVEPRIILDRVDVTANIDGNKEKSKIFVIKPNDTHLSTALLNETNNKQISINQNEYIYCEHNYSNVTASETASTNESQLSQSIDEFSQEIDSTIDDGTATIAEEDRPFQLLLDKFKCFEELESSSSDTSGVDSHQSQSDDCSRSSDSIYLDDNNDDENYNSSNNSLSTSIPYALGESDDDDVYDTSAANINVNYPVQVEEVEEEANEEEVVELQADMDVDLSEVNYSGSDSMYDNVSASTTSFNDAIANDQTTSECNDTAMDESTETNNSNVDLEQSRKMLSSILTQMLQINENRLTDPSKNCTETGKIVESIHIFCNVCINFLRDRCYNLNCKFTHKMPTCDVVYQNLDIADVEDVMQAHNELLTVYDKLLITYFAVFCKHYGKIKYREQLRKMIYIGVDTKYNGHSFLKHIINGFVISGMIYHTSVDVVINEIETMLSDEDQLCVLFDIILDNRNKKMQDHLKHYEDVFYRDNHTFLNVAIEKLLCLQLANGDHQLLPLSLKILKKCTITTLRKVNDTLLGEYLRHCKICGMKEVTDIYRRAAIAGLKLNSIN